MSTTYHIYETHPAAELFPMMPEKEIKELADDIRINGLREPVTMYEGKVLDGRNRIKACEIAGVEPSFLEFPPDQSPARYVCSKNLTRRHLSASQRSMAVFAIQEILAKEAKSRMSRGGKLSVRQGVEIIPQGEKGSTRDKLAEIAHVNSRYISDAKAIQEGSPELAAEVLAGNVTIPEAKRRLKGDDAGKNKSALDENGTIDAVLLVVELIVGAMDRDQRKGIIRETLLGAITAQMYDTPCIIMLSERYREGSLDYYLPTSTFRSLPKGWTSLEEHTRVVSCRAFSLKCKRLNPGSNSSDSRLEKRARNTEEGINCALQELRKRDWITPSQSTIENIGGDAVPAVPKADDE